MAQRRKTKTAVRITCRKVCEVPKTWCATLTMANCAPAKFYAGTRDAAMLQASRHMLAVDDYQR